MMSSVQRSNAERLWIPLGLFLLAFVIRILAAEGAVYGDELITLRESQNLGINLNGIGFSTIYRLWVAVSTDLFWLRLLPTIFGSASVVLCYWWLSAWRFPQVAIIASLLLSISPVAIEYSQQMRFYGFALFASLLFLWLYALHMRYGKLPLAVLFAAALLVLSSLVLSVLLIGVVFMHYLLSKHPRIFRTVVVATGAALLIIIIAALLDPNVFKIPFQIMSRIAYLTTRDYSEPRGWSPIIAAKVLFLGYHVTLGQYTYPLDLAVTAPSLLLFAAIASIGALYLYRSHRTSFYFVLLSGAFALLVYLVFDPIMPAWFTAGANVRLVIWIVPIFLWVVAEGIYALRRQTLQIVALSAVIAVQLFGYASMVTSAWEKADVSLVAETLKPYASQEKTLIIADGRSSGFIEFNLQQPNNLRLIWDYHGQPDLVERLRTQGIDRVVVVSADFKDAERCTYSDVLAQLREFKIVRGLVDYPYFIYEFDLTAMLDEMLTPVSAFHMRYQDVRLPQTIVWEGNTYELVGMASLPDCHNQNAWQVALNGRDVQRVALFSHIVNRVSLTPETTVAKLTFVTEDDERVEIAIKVGQHTQAWDAPSEACQGCTSIFDWRKRIALVGASGYDGAYRDFQARVWGTSITLPQAIKAKYLSVEAAQADATFNLWGLLVQ